MRSRAGQFRGSAPSSKPLLVTSSPTTEISIEFQPPANANHLGARSESQGPTRCGSHVGRREPISDQGCFCDCLSLSDLEVTKRIDRIQQLEHCTRDSIMPTCFQLRRPSSLGKAMSHWLSSRRTSLLSRGTMFLREPYQRSWTTDAYHRTGPSLDIQQFSSHGTNLCVSCYVARVGDLYYGRL
jgi:hypothetical protein